MYMHFTATIYCTHMQLACMIMHIRQCTLLGSARLPRAKERFTEPPPPVTNQRTTTKFTYSAQFICIILVSYACACSLTDGLGWR